jgi:hypothetical protein
MEAAIDAGRVTWERGLLRKGLGLCHGVAGNGYALLSLYRATKDVLWLHRAVQLGLFAASDEGRALHAVPDHPLSLFEGLAGCAAFLHDLLEPERSWFPGFELPGER